MLIRDWVGEDNQQIAELERICFSDAWSLEMITETQEESNFMGVVCEIEGKVVGYAGAIYAFDTSDIALVAVSPDFRRRQIAQKMLAVLQEKLISLEVRCIYLEVRKSNEPAKALYEKCGFEAVGIRKNYYENTEDAIVMAKVV